MIKPERKCVGVRAVLRSGSLFSFQPAVLCEPELNSRFWKVLLSPFSPVFKVLEDSRQILVAANMRPDDPFPMDDKIKEGLARFPSSLCHSEALFSSRSLHSSRAWPSCVTDPFFLFSSCACSDISFLLSFLCVLSLIPAAYSHVVENTAFFGDVVLRFPRIVHHYYDRNSEWGGLLRWGLNFCNQTGVFTGGAHQHVLTLVRAHYSNLSCALAGPPPPCC